MGGSPFFSRYLFVFISDTESLFTSLPNFFCVVVHNFLTTGRIILISNGVAAAPAVATTASAVTFVV